MRRITLFAGAALMCLATPTAALAQGQAQGQGKGKGGGQAAESRGGGKEKGGGQGQQGRGNDDRRGGETRSAAKGPPDNRGGGSQSAERRGGKERPAAARDDRPGRSDARGPARADRGRDVDVKVVDARDRDRMRVRVLDGDRYRWSPGLVAGCPPGLAKKNNGCMPPGQARQVAAARDPLRYWSRYAPWWDEVRRDDWRYWNGYAYRFDPLRGVATSFMPLVGGALWPGQVWPTGYTSYYPADPYYNRYYGLSGPYDYRYANGALFAVDPQTQAISSIAALLTGDSWAVGAPMPTGYSVYNVPPMYRTRYYDTPDAWYRYSDGYVYRVDPQTMLIAEAISLLV